MTEATTEAEPRVQIQRLRLRRAHVKNHFPWKQAYVVPESAFDRLFDLFGTCVSYPWRATVDWTPHIDWEYEERRLTKQGLEIPEGSRIVILVTETWTHGRLKQFTSEYVAKWEQRVENKVRVRNEAHLRVLQNAIDPGGVVLHLGPSEEMSQSMCGQCACFESHLQGLCNPGLTACVYGLQGLQIHHYRRDTRRPAKTKVSA